MCAFLLFLIQTALGIFSVPFLFFNNPKRIILPNLDKVLNTARLTNGNGFFMDTAASDSGNLVANKLLLCLPLLPFDKGRKGKINWNQDLYMFLSHSLLNR